MKNRLLELRREKKWSQSILGEYLGVSRQTINAIEQERYDPSLPLAFSISRLFGHPIEFIFDPGDNSRGGSLVCAPPLPSAETYIAVT